MEFDKEQIRSDLREGIVEVRFTKTDGSERVLNATLKEEHLPEIKPVDPDAPAKKKKVPNPDVQNVWDVDAKGWRSFRWDTVTDIQKTVL